MLDINEIKNTIPHRDPFLFVDEIIELDRDARRIVGVKRLTGGEPFFAGHFPGHPIMPGVLMIEAMAQTAGVLVLREEQYKGKLAYFMSINNAKFRKPVFPPCELVFDVQITKERSRIMQCQGKATVNGEVVCEGDLMFGIVDR